MKLKLWRTTHLLLLAGLLLGGGAFPALAQNNPVPLINQPLVPDAVAPGGPAFTLTVNGTGFVAGAVVNWTVGTAVTPLATTFITRSRLTAFVPATLTAAPTTASLTVANSAMGVTSNVALFPISTPTASIVFSESAFGASASPYGLATGDFNGDGKLDLAVANIDVDSVSILLGNGNGTFANHVDYSAGSGPTSVLAGDFNGDGKLDLAVTNQDASSLSILLGNGDGTFQSHVDYATATFPEFMVTADVNGDGKLDLVVAAGNGISVLLGNGDGTFQPHVDYSTAGGGGASVATGDFNSDGNLDIVAANSVGTLSIFLGNGDGTFQPPAQYTVHTDPESVTAADLNGDGKTRLDRCKSKFRPRFGLRPIG